MNQCAPNVSDNSFTCFTYHEYIYIFQIMFIVRSRPRCGRSGRAWWSTHFFFLCLLSLSSFLSFFYFFFIVSFLILLTPSLFASFLFLMHTCTHVYYFFFLANSAREGSVIVYTGLNFHISPLAFGPLALIRARPVHFYRRTATAQHSQ